MEAQILVRTKTPDPVATTAWLTLTGRLGFTDLESLGRRLYVELAFPGEQKATARAVSRILEHSTLLANPNKEDVDVEIGGSVVLEGPAVLVWQAEGAEAPRLLARITRQFPDEGTIAIRRATLWLPRFRAAVTDAEEQVERMARTGGEKRGLLANVHADDTAVVTGHIPAGFLASAAAAG